VGESRCMRYLGGGHIIGVSGKDKDSPQNVQKCSCHLSCTTARSKKD